MCLCVVNRYLDYKYRLMQGWQKTWVSELEFYVTCNNISVTYVTAHRCAGGLKKTLYLQSGSQCNRHFAVFFNVPVQAPTQGHPYYTPVFRRNVLLYGDVRSGLRPTLRPSVRPSVRPPVFHTFPQHALTYWADMLYVALNVLDLNVSPFDYTAVAGSGKVGP